MIDLTDIIKILVTLMSAVITAFVVPWLKKKISKEDMTVLLELVRIAVYAAEQLFPSEQGKDKLQYVLDFLVSKGYDVDDKAIRNAIEAEVLALHRALVGGEK